MANSGFAFCNLFPPNIFDLLLVESVGAEPLDWEGGCTSNAYIGNRANDIKHCQLGSLVEGGVSTIILVLLCTFEII